MPPDGEIHVLGAVVIDTIITLDRLPGHDEKALARGVARSPGGPPTYVASAIARLGRTPLLHSALGDDDAASQIISKLGVRGVATTGIGRYPGERTPECLILVDETGEKAIIIVPATDALRARYAEAMVLGNRPVLVTHLFDPAVVAEALSRVRAAGGLSLVDLEWPEFERWGKDAIFSALPEADVICTNGQFLELFRGAQDVNSATAFATELAQGRLAAVVTLGARGLVVASGETTHHIPALQVTATNTTGAGDTFIGALAVALNAGYAPDAAAAIASRAAGIFLAGTPLDFDAIATAVAGASA